MRMKDLSASNIESLKWYVGASPVCSVLQQILKMGPVLVVQVLFASTAVVRFILVIARQTVHMKCTLPLLISV